MELEQLARLRRMTRSFRADPIPAAVLEQILSIAVTAPSAGFTQGVEWVVMEGEAVGRFFAVATDPEFRAEPGAMAGLLEAPVILLPVADQTAYVARYGEPDKAASKLAGVAARGWPVPYWIVDAAFAAMLALLAAADLEVGALFFRLHAETAAVRQEFAIPEDRVLIGAIAVGYPADDAGPRGSPSRRSKRSVDDLVHRNRW
jgi:nitroreductase